MRIFKMMVKKWSISGLFILLVVALLNYGTIKKLLRVGEKISFGDYELYVRDYGKGGPIVIIEGGVNCGTSLYYWLQYRTSKKTRVITYDHAGLYRSTPHDKPRILPNYVEELRALMKKKELSPPYILVGHSMGGLIIRYYTYLYPEEIAGLVFIDHPHEDWFRYIRANWSDEEIEEYFKWWYPDLDSTDKMNTYVEEKYLYKANCDSIRGKSIPNDIPVLMFTGTNPFHFRKGEKEYETDLDNWVNMQGALIEGNENARQIVDVGAGHCFHFDRPDLVQENLDAFIEKCRLKKGS